MDRLPHRLQWIARQNEQSHAAGLFRTRSACRLLPDGQCEVDGRRLHHFASNDYLGLSSHPQVIEAARAAIQEGAGARSSALVFGRTQWQRQLEEAIAAFERTPDAMVFPSGYAANVGTVTSLVGPGDTVFCDRLNHASLVDGCRLSRARLRIYRHDRLEVLERELANAAGDSRRLIVTDGVFSMDGDLGPLPQLCELADRFDAMLLVDEAHGTGVFGKHGRGVCEHFQVEDRVDVRVGTLSKAAGSLGGFVSGPSALIDHLWNNARTHMFSTALSPVVCAAASCAVQIIGEAPQRRETLWTNTRRLREALAAADIPVRAHSTGPIVPVILESPEVTMTAAEQLAARGFVVGAIRPPTVPHGTARLRLCPTAAHREEQIDALVGALRDVIR